MKYLVTGGAGFIGSHLCEYLLARGHQVTALDDLSTGSLENIKSIKTNPGFQLVVDTVLNHSVLAGLVSGADIICHLAAAVGVKNIIENPLQSLKTNVEGTLNVLEAAVPSGQRVVLTSTSEVYGKNENVPFSEENDMVLGPTTIRRWGYACSKALDEFLALAYFSEKKVPVVIGRLFNTIGPRQTGRYGMVVPRFVGQALAGEEITVYGDGKQTRSFTYVSDVVAALYLLSQNKNIIGGVFNIGNTEEITIRELAEKVKMLCRSDSRIVHLPMEEAYRDGFEDMRRRLPDLSRIKEAIGYSPKVNLDEALKKVIASFRE
ncbi:MAG: GDP-mannose 4,6-dehydratase [Candidatus Omnitrophica bacterium]|nr:GDP-mannose 4,6-dehydratase [Candidatus Omnitrophota bacterium]